MKLYIVQHEPNGKRFLFRDGREEKSEPIKMLSPVIVETISGVTDGKVVAGPLIVPDGQDSAVCAMFDAYLPIRPILAVGILATKHLPTIFYQVNKIDDFEEA